MATGSINISSNISRNSLLSVYQPYPCSDLFVQHGNTKLYITWKDPEDYTSTDGKLVKWAYTRIVRKTGSYPKNENDGTVVIESSVKNQYAESPFTDTGLTNNTNYYYAAFACSSDGVYCYQPVQYVCKPLSYRKMTVVIDLTNSNPATWGTYADDAVDMSPGKNNAEWDYFFGYKPCLFKDGAVVGYLNPNDYTKFEDGSSADITSGNAGDVMIEFPRRGIKISKANNKLTVSMTDDLTVSDYTYYAHQRGSVKKDYFYLGAYLGNIVDDKLRSISGNNPSGSQTLANYYSYARRIGTNYGILCYYQYLYLQVMCILQYRGNTNTKVVHGVGVTSNTLSTTKKCGRANTRGMMYGDSDVIKIFGIEDAWGNGDTVLNNLCGPSSHSYAATTTDDTKFYLESYTKVYSYSKSISTNYQSDCVGTSEAGFIACEGGDTGSSSTYFAARCGGDVYCYFRYGGMTSVNDVGLFSTWPSSSRSGEAYERVFARLQYL